MMLSFILAFICGFLYVILTKASRGDLAELARISFFCFMLIFAMTLVTVWNGEILRMFSAH